MHSSWETEPVAKPIIIILLEFFKLHLSKLSIIFHGVFKPRER